MEPSKKSAQGFAGISLLVSEVNTASPSILNSAQPESIANTGAATRQNSTRAATREPYRMPPLPNPEGTTVTPEKKWSGLIGFSLGTVAIISILIISNNSQKSRPALHPGYTVGYPSSNSVSPTPSTNKPSTPDTVEITESEYQELLKLPEDQRESALSTILRRPNRGRSAVNNPQKPVISHNSVMSPPTTGVAVQPIGDAIVGLDALADQLFFAKHPELQGRTLELDEDDNRLEWENLRYGNELIDYIFYGRHPELQNRKLLPSEKELTDEWKRIAKEVKLPKLAPSSALQSKGNGISTILPDSESRSVQAAGSTGQTPPPMSTQPPAKVPPSPQLLPSNGFIERYHSSESLAPLTIRTRGDGQHYFVKLADWNTGITALTVFIHGGQSVELTMPLGSYKLKYASGITWYGESELFGVDTHFSMADARFDFTVSGDQVSGYTVELFLQQDGNLQTRDIPRSTF